MPLQNFVSFIYMLQLVSAEGSIYALFIGYNDQTREENEWEFQFCLNFKAHYSNYKKTRSKFKKPIFYKKKFASFASSYMVQLKKSPSY